ncbi:hypothetical protein BHM03_00039586 [Ensete ventricosum]|nr:hypothetical protein BHM03_00039586 [Ensete ventricosum]
MVERGGGSRVDDCGLGLKEAIRGFDDRGLGLEGWLRIAVDGSNRFVWQGSLAAEDKDRWLLEKLVAKVLTISRNIRSPRKQETAAKIIVRQRHPWHRRSFAFTGISHWLHPCNTVSRSRPLCTKDMASVSDYPTSSKNMTHDTWHRGVDVENEAKRGMAVLLYVASAIVARTASAPVTTRLSRIIRDMSN